MESNTGKYSEIIGLIKQWEIFKEKFPGGTLSNFGRWISHESSPVNPSNATEDFIVSTTSGMEEKKSVPDLANRAMAGAMLGRLTMFVRNYTKVPFQQIGIGSMDEFKILSTIDRLKNPSKSVLSQASLMEFTTINDMLKRMEKKGWIVQVKDEKDKRLSRVMLSASGQQFVRQVYGVMASIQPSLLGDLTEAEQSLFMALLQKLNHFHTNYFHKHYKK